MRPHEGFWVPGECPLPFVGDSTKAKIEWKYAHDLVLGKLNHISLIKRIFQP